VPDTPSSPERALPGVTACSLCAGETLGDGDPLPGGQMARLRALADRGAARLTLVECLDECERGDVVVGRPAGARRRAGAEPVWFERLAGDQATGVLEAWLRDGGGPGGAPLPEGLAEYVIDRRADVPDPAVP
jgi:(2Fe-2S) ferredoxin